MPAKIPRGGRQSNLTWESERGRVSELSRHLVEAQEEERKRISRELHDEAGQGLMALRLYLGLLASDGNADVAPKIEEAICMLDRTIGDLRRIIARLSPRTLNELGLLAAIRKEARSLSKTAGMKGTLDLPANLSVAHETEVVIYRTVQEALHNIAKHSKATTFNIRLERDNRTLILRIEDDGVGFVSKPNFQGSFGLLGMRERIAALGGTVRIRSREGRGTKIRVTLSAPRVEKLDASERYVAMVNENLHQEPRTGKQRRAATIRGLIKSSSESSHAHPVPSS